MSVASRLLFPFIGGMAVVARIIAMAIGLRVLLPNSDPPSPSEWLTELEQEQLADLVVSFLPGQPIAACLWEGRSPSDIIDVLGLSASARRWETRSREGREVSFVIVEGRAVTGSYDEAEGPGYFCWVPS